MSTSSIILDQSDSPFQYLEIRDFQSRIEELQRANLNLKMSLIEQENRMSQLMVDGKVDQSVITEFIQNTKLINDLNSQIRNLTSDLEDAKTTISDFNIKQEAQKKIEKQLRDEISILKAKNQIYENQNQAPDSPGSNKIAISLKFEISKLKQDIATQEAKNAELTVEILNLQSKLNDYENDEIQNDFAVSRVKRALDDAKNELIKANEENLQLKNDLSILNQQIKTKNEKIVKKSKKIKAFKNVLQNYMKQFEICSEKCKERNKSFQSSINELVKSFNEKIESSNKRYMKIQSMIVNSSSKILNNSKRKYQDRIFLQSDIIHRLASLSAKLVNLPSSEIPEIDDFVKDESTLEMFIGRINSANEMQKNNIHSNIYKHLTEENYKQKRNQLSINVSNFMIRLQGSLNNMTNTLHQDHLQLIETLSSQKP